jgi:hypothetical protein
MRWAFRILSGLCIVNFGYIWTVGQGGFGTVNNNLCDLWKDTFGHKRIATSVDGTLTGLGGNLIIIDDPLKLGDAMSEAVRARVIEWYRSTLLSRGDDKTTTRIVVVMQRVHQNDLVGYLRVVVDPGMRRRPLLGNRDISGRSLRSFARTAPGRPEVEADSRPMSRDRDTGRESLKFRCSRRIVGSCAWLDCLRIRP